MCPKLNGVDLNVAIMLKRPRPISENGFYPTVLWKRYCRKVNFWPLGPTHFATLAGMFVTWFQSRSKNRNTFIEKPAWPSSGA